MASLGCGFGDPDAHYYTSMWLKLISSDIINAILTSTIRRIITKVAWRPSMYRVGAHLVSTFSNLPVFTKPSSIHLAREVIVDEWFKVPYFRPFQNKYFRYSSYYRGKFIVDSCENCASKWI